MASKTVIKSLPPIEVVASKGLTGIHGTVEQTLPVIELEALWSFHGSAELTLPSIELTPAVLLCTSFSNTFDLLTVEIESYGYHSGLSATLTLPTIQQYGHMGRSLTMSVSQTLPVIELEALLSTLSTITVAKTLPNILLEAEIRPNDLFLVVNPTNFAVTEYTLSPKAIAEKDGTIYISDGTKIYTLSGDDDDGTDIASVIQLGLSDADTNKLKRVTDTFLTLKSDGVMSIYLVDDETVCTTARTIASTSDKIKTQRAKIELGNKCSFYSLKIQNVSGADFEIAKIIVSGRVLNRRFHV
jgi:hypothetical protein